MNHPAHDWEQQREQLSALLDNELSAQERAALETHLESCDWCRDELESLRRTRALLRALPQPALPRSFILPLEPAAMTEPQRAAPALRPAPVPVAAAQRRTNLPGGRAPNRHRPVQVLQWLSAIAAVLGIVFLLSGVFSTFSNGRTTASNASVSNSAQGGAQDTGAPRPTSPTHLPYASPPPETGTGAGTPAPTAEKTTATPRPTSGTAPGQSGSQGASSSSPLGQIVSTTSIGLLLLVLSVGGFITTWALRRRW